MKVIAVGAGGFGRSWVRAYHELGVEVVAAIDPSSEARESAKLTFGLTDACVFSDYKLALIGNISADAVCISSPPSFHVEQVAQALNSGLHVLVVKPLAESLEAARELVDLANTRDRKLVVAQQKRYLPAFLRLREIVASGDLGKLGVVSVRLAVKGTAWPAGFGWRSKRTHPVLMGAGSHQVDLLRWILGREIESVQATTWNVPWSPFEGQSSAQVFYQMSGGLPVTYNVNWAPKEDDIVDFFSGWRLEGMKGVATVDGAELTVNGERAGLAPEGSPKNLDALNVEVMRRFVGYVRDGVDPGISGEDNLRTLAALYATISSANERVSYRVQGDKYAREKLP
jgi:predicted dehydrogenase